MGINIFLKTLQLLVYLYIVVAVIFTTWVYVLSPVSELLWHRTRAEVHGSRGANPGPPVNMRSLLRFGKQEAHLDIGSDLGSVSLDEQYSANLWPSWYTSSEIVHIMRSNVSSRKLGRVPGYGIRQETLLSKAFSEAMHPTRIIPFYFKAAASVETDDVTITTLVTSNRFRVLKQLVERYRGPVSVTIHIPLPLHASFSSLQPDHPSRTALHNLHALYASSPLFPENVDVHLALSPFTSALSPETISSTSTEGEGGRQFNVWRNAARLFARTEFVMMLDVDFAVCTDWRGFVRDAVRAASSSPIRHLVRTGRRSQPPPQDGANITEIVQRLREGTAALVVPAFEYRKQEDGIDQRAFPMDKEVGGLAILDGPSSSFGLVECRRTLSH